LGRCRIDLVVQGRRGRLAVELDGDAYHGAGRWETGWNRQAILERLGWGFYRIRGSTYYRLPDAALTALWGPSRGCRSTPLANGHVSTRDGRPGYIHRPSHCGSGCRLWAPWLRELRQAGSGTHGRGRGSPAAHHTYAPLSWLPAAAGVLLRRWGFGRCQFSGGPGPPNPPGAAPSLTLRGGLGSKATSRSGFQLCAHACEQLRFYSAWGPGNIFGFVRLDGFISTGVAAGRLPVVYADKRWPGGHRFRGAGSVLGLR